MTNGSARLQQRRMYTSRSQEHIWCMPKEELLKPLHKWTSKKVRPIHGENSCETTSPDGS